MPGPPCPNCGSKSSLYLRTKDYNRRVDSKAFSYYMCSACRLIFLDPVPDDLGAYYPEDYYPFAPDLDELANRAQHEQFKIDIVKQFKSAGSLVEIGPGGGAFAFLARSAGFDVRVIEMNQASCDYLAGTVGVRAVCTNDEIQALSDTEPADVIALWHVAEHLRNPFELLKVAAAKLKPGGILVIAAPNPSSLQFKILRSRWVHVDAPRHVRLIPTRVLESVAAASGLRVILETTGDVGSLFWNDYGWQFSFANQFTGERTRGYAMRAGAFMTRAMRRLEQQEGRGSAYTIVFERPA